MSSNDSHLYEFGDFRFDAERNVLMRFGKPVSITPKTLELLSALVENHGQIVEKERLMAEVWAGTFVEESNLTFNIRQLRKTLGDDAREPTFIETVPRRGYRFIAEVREITDGSFANNDARQTDARPIEKKSIDWLRIVRFTVSAAVLIFGLTAIGFWYVSSKDPNSAPVLTAPFSLEKLSNDGKAVFAVISPDGKNVVYTSGIEGKQSVWLRQLESANNVEIIPPSDEQYFGLALSPDGVFLYFVRSPNIADTSAAVYRVSIFGGVPQKIADETQGWISISPDGKQISFVRCFYRDDEYCSLWIADAADGKNERKIVSRPRPIRIGDNRISPDGASIAFAVGQSLNQSNEFGLMEIDIQSGVERELSQEKFFNIKHLEWLPDQSGWLLTARKNREKDFRIWQIAATTGSAAPLTKDSESYVALSLSKDSNRLVSTKVKSEFRVRLFQIENPSDNRILAEATDVVFAPNGDLLVSSSMAGSSDIWRLSRDGSRRQMTNHSANEMLPIVLPDGERIFFFSNRTGEGHVWRMNADGSNQTQITKKEGGFPLFAAPDGKWLYYLSSRHRTLWRVSTDGSGEEQLIFDKRTELFYAFSPDGLQIAFAEKRGKENVLKVVSLADKQNFKTFKLAVPKAGLKEFKWSPDGKFLAYILAAFDSENSLWFQPLDTVEPRRIADLGNESVYEMSGLAFAPDGKSFAIVQGGWNHDAVLIGGLK